MAKAIGGVAAALMLALTGPASATVTVYPVPSGDETARFLHGVAIVTLQSISGAVEITPLIMNHGKVSFKVAVLNRLTSSVNFGIENINADSGGSALTVLTEAELERRAKSHATWAKIGTAVLTGLASTAAANTYTTTQVNGTLLTPHGIYATSAEYRDNSAGLAEAYRLNEAGSLRMSNINRQLDGALDTLGQEIVQTTTVDSGLSYAGRFVLAKPERSHLPYDVHLLVRWNGVAYPFTFRVTEDGRNLPPSYPMPAAGTVAPLATVGPSTPRAAIMPASLMTAVSPPKMVATRAEQSNAVRLTRGVGNITEAHRSQSEDAIIVPIR